MVKLSLIAFPESASLFSMSSLSFSMSDSVLEMVSCMFENSFPRFPTFSVTVFVIFSVLFSPRSLSALSFSYRLFMLSLLSVTVLSRPFKYSESSSSFSIVCWLSSLCACASSSLALAATTGVLRYMSPPQRITAMTTAIATTTVSCLFSFLSSIFTELFCFVHFSFRFILFPFL